MIIDSQEKALTYARNILQTTGKEHVVFELKKPSRYGWTWATCLKSEMDLYVDLAKNGFIPVDSDR